MHKIEFCKNFPDYLLSLAEVDFRITLYAYTTRRYNYGLNIPNFSIYIRVLCNYANIFFYI